MREYPSIQTVYKRNPETKFRTLLEGQYADEAFAYLADCEWIFTEKVDGTNIRVMIEPGNDAFPGVVRFGGKSDRAQIPAFLVTKLEERFLSQRDALLAAFPEGGCLYGEGYGARIQKGGGNYRDDQDFVLFDVKVGEWWLRRDALTEIADRFGLDVVPTIGYGNLGNMVELAKQGFKSRWGDFQAEGIVARPAVELQTRSGKRIITKIKHKDFHHETG